MKQTTRAITSKNASTDQICAAIAYSYLRRKVYNDACIATIQMKTEKLNYLLEKFHIKYAKQQKYFEIRDCVGPIAQYLNNDEVICINNDEPVARALELQDIFGHRVLPCVDEQGKCIGLVQFNDLINVISSVRNEECTKQIKTSEHMVLKTTKGTLLTKRKLSQNIKDFNICVLSGNDDYIMPKLVRLSNTELECTIFITAKNDQAINYLIQHNAAIVIVCKSFIIPRERHLDPDEFCLHTVDLNLFNIDQVDTNNTVVIQSEMSVAAITLFVKHSQPVGQFIKDDDKEFIFNQTTSIQEIRKKMAKNPNYDVVAIIDDESHVTGVISRFDLLNENILNIYTIGFTQNSLNSPCGMDHRGVQVMGMIDNKDMAKNSTIVPTYSLVRPYAAISSVVYELFTEFDVKIPVNIAGLLLGGIISATKILKSPQTKNFDKEAAKALAQISGQQLVQFGSELVVQKQQLSIEERVTQDVMEYQTTYGRIRIAQIETDDLSFEAEQIGEIEQILKNQKKFLFNCCMITDVVGGNSIFYVYTEINMAEFDQKFYYQHFNDIKNCYLLTDMMSRKTQLVPHLMNVLSVLDFDQSMMASQVTSPQ
uniref:Inorganic diphosphatase n=1 Tax=Trepomonas sp. PC1 TaxID=1076344 RepID=A0A146KJU2_9EUKA|eukprot:JAP95701.1 Inorganic diphosphatase [Trepomonas sp. PC1]